MGKQLTDEQIAAALLESKTRKEAAERLNITPRALYARMQSHELQAVLDVLRADRLRNKLEALDEAQAQAVQCLLAIMNNEQASAGDRLKAAQFILSAGTAARQELNAAEARAVGNLREAAKAEYIRECGQKKLEATKKGEFHLDLSGFL